MNTPSTSLLLIAVVAVCALFGGCTPYRYTEAPAVGGQVVSAATHRPVAGATVSMRAQYAASAQVRTDASGRFHLPALQRWSLFIPGMEGAHPDGVLRVEAAGYRPFQEAGIGSPQSPRGGPTKPFGLIEYGRIGPDLEHIQVTLTPGA